MRYSSKLSFSNSFVLSIVTAETDFENPSNGTAKNIFGHVCVDRYLEEKAFYSKEENNNKVLACISG